MEINLTQNRPVKLQLRQGLNYVITTEWLVETELSTPRVPDYEAMDVTGYSVLALLVDGPADENPTVLHTFSASPDANGNKYVIDEPSATVDIYMSNELTTGLSPFVPYFLEVKLIDSASEPVQSILTIIKVEPEYSRVV